MDVRTKLKAYVPAVREAEALARVYDEARKVWIRSPKLDGMPKASGVAGLDVQMVKIDAAMRRFEAARAKALQICEEIEDMIEKLQDADERTVLRLKYISGFTWEIVASEMCWSESTVRRIHARAVAELEDLT